MPYCWSLGGGGGGGGSSSGDGGGGGGGERGNSDGCQISLGFPPGVVVEISSLEEIAIEALIISTFCFSGAEAGGLRAGRSRVGQMGQLVVMVSGVWAAEGGKEVGDAGEGGCVRVEEGGDLGLGAGGEGRNISADVEALKAFNQKGSFVLGGNVD